MNLEEYFKRLHRLAERQKENNEHENNKKTTREGDSWLQ